MLQAEYLIYVISLDIQTSLILLNSDYIVCTIFAIFIAYEFLNLMLNTN